MTAASGLNKVVTDTAAIWKQLIVRREGRGEEWGAIKKQVFDEKRRRRYRAMNA